jgi:hypothetical protein
METRKTQLHQISTYNEVHQSQVPKQSCNGCEDRQHTKDTDYNATSDIYIWQGHYGGHLQKRKAWITIQFNFKRILNEFNI